MSSLRGKWATHVAQLTQPRTPEQLPVLLQRRRIYIFPTAFGAFIALLLATMLLGALNYNNNPALLLALLLTGTALASTVIAHMQLSGLCLETIAAEPVEAGMPMQLRLSVSCSDLRHRSGLRFDLQQVTTFCTLEPAHNAQVELTLDTHRRGWCKIGKIRISTTQPLGLVCAWAWLWPLTPLLVYPRAETAGPSLPTGNQNAKRMQQHAQGEDLHQLRPYRAGDAHRTIAWKHSAHRNLLMVREYEQPIGGEVVLDWHKLTAMPYEDRIARLARWVNEAERSRRHYRLLLPGRVAIGPALGPQHRHQCLRALALLPHG